jgi:hypothetical protein
MGRRGGRQRRRGSGRRIVTELQDGVKSIDLHQLDHARHITDTDVTHNSKAAVGREQHLLLQSHH